MEAGEGKVAEEEAKMASDEEKNEEEEEEEAANLAASEADHALHELGAADGALGVMYSDDDGEMSEAGTAASSRSSTSGRSGRRQRRGRGRRRRRRSRGEKGERDSLPPSAGESKWDEPRGASEGDAYDEPDAETRREMLQRSQKLMQHRFKQREKVKRELLEGRSQYRQRMQAKRVEKQLSWQSKMERSPFLVNLIAETERIEEENRLRHADAERRQRLLAKRRNKVKNDIILKALQEASDLDALRAEKRLIMEEESRLKAMLEVEKTNLNRKQDLMAAMRAEKQRKQMQLEYRRRKRLEFEEEIQRQHKLALREKLGLVEEQPEP